MKLNQRCETGRINPKQTARPTSRKQHRELCVRRDPTESRNVEFV